MARRHGVDRGSRITQRWLAEERDERAEQQMATLRAAQRAEAERIVRQDLNDFYSEDGSSAPPEWDAGGL